MSWGRGRRDLDGIAGDLAREEERRLAEARARLGPSVALDDRDAPRSWRTGLVRLMVGRIRSALRTR